MGFNIFLNNIGGYFISYPSNKGDIDSKLIFPNSLSRFGVFYKHFSDQYSFNTLYYLLRRIPRRIFDNNLYVFFELYHCIYVKLVNFRYLLKYLFQVSAYLDNKYIFNISLLYHVLFRAICLVLLIPILSVAIILVLLLRTRLALCPSPILSLQLAWRIQLQRHFYRKEK